MTMSNERADDGDVALNPWMPEPHPVTRAILGKLGEELGELSAALSRCMIQGIHEVEPVTKVANRDWVQKETADVLAGISLLIDHLGLDEQMIWVRAQNKIKHLLKWHAMIGRALAATHGPGARGTTRIPMQVEVVAPPDIAVAVNARAEEYRKTALRVIEVLSDEFGTFDDERAFRPGGVAERPIMPSNLQRMASRLEEVLIDGLA
jgi:NTP pyrophosphatase (non-canonical NTP hydrolase)